MQQAPYQKPLLHFFICTNDRTGTNDDKPSCGPRITNELVKELKHWTREQGMLGIIQCTRTGCLGYCHENGSTVLIYPEGKVYQGIQCIDDLKLLITEELNKTQN